MIQFKYCFHKMFYILVGDAAVEVGWIKSREKLWKNRLKMVCNGKIRVEGELLNK